MATYSYWRVAAREPYATFYPNFCWVQCFQWPFDKSSGRCSKKWIPTGTNGIEIVSLSSCEGEKNILHMVSTHLLVGNLVFNSKVLLGGVNPSEKKTLLANGIKWTYHYKTWKHPLPNYFLNHQMVCSQKGKQFENATDHFQCQNFMIWKWKAHISLYSQTSGKGCLQHRSQLFFTASAQPNSRSNWGRNATRAVEMGIFWPSEFWTCCSKRKFRNLTSSYSENCRQVLKHSSTAAMFYSTDWRILAGRNGAKCWCFPIVLWFRWLGKSAPQNGRVRRIGCCRWRQNWHQTVAREGFRSQCRQKLAASGRFWKLNPAKFAPRCRARAVSKSKSLKTDGLGTSLEVYKGFAW